MNPRALPAVRRLAHLLLERAAAGTPTDLDGAARLVDARRIPSSEQRLRVAREALSLARAAASRLGRDHRFAGELRTNLRIALRDRKDAPFTVTVPSVVVRPDGTAAVVVLAPAGDRAAEARARRYRLAVGRLRKRRADAFLFRSDGTVEKVPVSRSGPRGAAYPGRGCSPSGHPQSGRRPR
ncbi:MAG: hypothetical protein F4228_01480 [Acidobacteria bacterium]|nr:hypothetical protein [Acidobacteriota bacterium]MYF13358.1 hypothetical protein [Acidobacteriota bacterium]MYI97228.1 hypothetical protein [Acidobacteriota bacterium]